MKTLKRLGPVEVTERGFEVIYFQDFYGEPCRLQMSSLAGYTQPGITAVWLGPTKRTADDADNAVQQHEMHLHRTQAKALIAHLQNWLERGTFKIPRTK